MSITLPKSHRICRAATIVTLTAFLASACGLGMDAQDRIDRGQLAYERGEYRAAIVDAKNVLREEPGNLAARLLLGRASVEFGDGVSAEKELRRAVELGAGLSGVIVDLGRALLLQAKFSEILDEVTPAMISGHVDRLTLMRLRGHALLELDQPVAARELYTKVLTADHGDIEAHLGIVQSYIEEQNFFQAREMLDQLLTSDDNFVAVWLASASLSMRTQNAQRAASDFSMALKLAQDESDQSSEITALSGLADAVLAQGNADDARIALTRMLEIAPQDTRTLLISARLAAVDADWGQAKRDLQEFLRRDPNYRPAQMLLGAVHKESGDLGQAEMYLSAVVTAQPGNAGARRLLAETRLKLNRAAEARQALQPILAGADTDIKAISIAAGASISLGEFDDATELLQRGIASDPQNIDLQMHLAFAYFRSGDQDRARQVLAAIPADAADGNEFRREGLLVLTQMAQGKRVDALNGARALQKRWIDRADAHNLVGSIEMSVGEYAAARRSFDESSRLAPDDVRPIRHLAQLDIAGGDLESANDRYLLILELQPQDASSMVALARISASKEKRDEARRWLEKAREADATSVTARIILSSLYLRSGESFAAMEVAREAIKLEPTNAILHNILGLAQFDQEDYRGAASSFEIATKTDPEEPSYRLNVARAQTKLGNDKSALAILQDSKSQDLQHLPSAIMLASLRAEAGDIDGAKEIARQLRQRYPGEASPHVLEAELFALGGKLMEATASYDRALSIDNTEQFAVRAFQIRRQAEAADQVVPLVSFLQEHPANSNMRIYLAQAYQGMNEIDKSHSEYERVLNSEPDNYVAANNLAWSYFLAGDVRAEAVARRAYEIQPGDGSVADTLGWILVRKGTIKEGVAILRDAVELSNGRAAVRYHLAAALAESGDAEEARGLLTDILAVDKTFLRRSDAELLLVSLQNDI